MTTVPLLVSVSVVPACLGSRLGISGFVCRCLGWLWVSLGLVKSMRVHRFVLLVWDAVKYV